MTIRAQRQWDHKSPQCPQRFQCERENLGRKLEVGIWRVYSDAQAKTLGLVDELAPLHGVISALAVDLGLEPDATVFEPQMRLGFFDMLTARAGDVIPEALNPATHSPLQYRMMH